MHVGNNRSAKRARESQDETDDILLNPAKRLRISSIEPLQGFMEGVVISNLTDITQNVVWMNGEDYDFFFPSYMTTRSTQQKAQHVQIANRVYMVAKKEWLADQSIGLTPAQWSDCESSGALFFDNGHCCQVSAYIPLKNAAPLTSVTFELCQSKEFGYHNPDTETYELVALRKLCRAKFEGKYAIPGQTFFLEHPHDLLKLKVVETACSVSNAQSNVRDTKNYFGLIADSTVFDFKAKQSNITITKPIVDSRVKLIFRVALSDRDNNLDKTPLPLVLDAQLLENAARTAFKDECFAIDSTTPIVYKKHLLNFSLVDVGCSEVGTTFTTPSKGYLPAYHFTDNALKLIAGDDVELTRGPALIACELEATVISAKRKRSSSPTGYKYVNVLELETALKKITENFTVGHTFYLHLQAASVEVKIKRAQPLDPLSYREHKRYKTLWQMAENTIIEFTSQLKGKWPLIDNLSESHAKLVTLKVELLSKQAISISEQNLCQAAKKAIHKGILLGQVFEAAVQGNAYHFTVTSFDQPDIPAHKVKYGLLGTVSDCTEIKLLNKSSSLAITAKSSLQDPIEQLKLMGLGGLSDKGKEMISEIVWERRPLIKQLLDKQQLHPTKGLLLAGPPGTGKTFLARCLGELLGCSEDRTQVISASSVYSKWVGESEANVRALFAPALKAAKRFKDNSEIFLLVIDEIDAILSSRSNASGSRWHNSVVAEFLTQMDGLEQFHNILVVGTTNRIDDLDAAVVRSGRFERQIAFDLPDLLARKEILQIHTSKMHEHSLISGCLDFDLLAKETDGFSGADIQLLVKMAAGSARVRVIALVKANLHLSPDAIVNSKEAMTSMKDFKIALHDFKSNRPSSKTPHNMYT